MAGLCKSCEYCMPIRGGIYKCSNSNIPSKGVDITETLDDVKHCYSEGLYVFVEKSRNEAVRFFPGTLLSQIKLDGRKYVEIIDKEGKMIKLKGSKAKRLFGGFEVERMIMDFYVVRAIFDRKMFNGEKYIEL